MNTPPPDLELEDLAGRRHTPLAPGRAVRVIVFWSSECPVAQRVEPQFHALRQEWKDEAEWLFIAANAGEPRAQLEAEAARRGIAPLHVDAEGRAAQALGATVTPEVLVIDRDGHIRYRGAVDDRTMRQGEATRQYLADALRALRAGVQPHPAETQPFGCAILGPFKTG